MTDHDRRVSILAKLAVVLAYLGIAGLVLALLTMLILPIFLIVTHNWPWFQPEASLIQSDPNGVVHSRVIGAFAALLIAFGIRLTRRSFLGLPVFSPLFGAAIGIAFWALYVRTALATASYFIFRWIMNLGSWTSVLWGLMAFLSGLAPGFLGASSILLYATYQDERLFWYTIIPALIGEMLDSLGGEVRTDEEIKAES